jgi:hypothetical protein
MMPVFPRLTNAYSSHVSCLATRSSAGLTTPNMNQAISGHRFFSPTNSTTLVHQNTAPFDYYALDTEYVAKAPTSVAYENRNTATKEINAKQARRTALCRHFSKKGFCTWGDACGLCVLNLESSSKFFSLITSTAFMTVIFNLM